MSSGHVQRLQAAALGGQRGDSPISHASRASDIEGGEAFLLREVFLNNATGGMTGAERLLLGPLLHKAVSCCCDCCWSLLPLSSIPLHVFRELISRLTALINMA